jgi:hypothetical protein
MPARLQKDMTRRANRILPRVKLALVLSFACAIFCGPGNLSGQAAPKQIAIPLPPMGWSSWNSFSITVDSQVIMAQAKAMVDTGMSKAGYRYINIDEGWWLGMRDAEGNFVVDPEAWPALASGERAGDMSNIVRYIHGLGLKAGIYTDAGHNGCSTLGPDIGPSYPHTGSEDHYEQDFLQFAKWGLDYVKVDWCGGHQEDLDPAIQYGEIARAIARAEAMTGHRLYFSICNWGNGNSWTWAPGIGGTTADIWRTSGDIVDPIVANSKSSGNRASFAKVLSNFDYGIHPEAEHTGFYNDPDMMVVGMAGLSEEENRAHMSLWAISAAPLLVGADLTKLSPQAFSTLTNPEVLAIDQDALGLQAVKIAQPGPGLEVWSKPLSAPGRRAVLLLNRTGAAAQIAVNWSDLGLSGSSSAAVRDPWLRKGVGDFSTSYAAQVPAKDGLLIVVQGKEGEPSVYKAGQMDRAGSAPSPQAVGTKTAMSSAPEGAAISHDSLVFKNVASRPHMALIRITYSNPGETIRFSDLRVNGRVATRIAFPPTGSVRSTAALWIQANLDREGDKNALDFSPPCEMGPSIESIEVH